MRIWILLKEQSPILGHGGIPDREEAEENSIQWFFQKATFGWQEFQGSAKEQKTRH